ncbi:hypothetical protein TUM4438_31300 [Shewanella sairae]|uniref:Uncharacterized protein n=1 Tax=Shewanella sairae TaxID=190310 RepID=A0ABQ4PLK7_9GAMM|nr:hypothetical protein [Shewanella sairae]MCL1131900.1 hypothetical protein [Shewanella sairae]GIU48888.1 hypothetical protein TUM4438_31300 [Shewanella sairae]
MLKIMYGFLHDSVNPSELCGKSYQSHAILNVKIINRCGTGCVFAALVDDYLDLYQDEINQYPTTSACISNTFYKVPHRRKPVKLRTDITDPIAAKKFQKKLFRRLNNLVMTTTNWKQFVGSRNLATESVLRNLTIARYEETA